MQAPQKTKGLRRNRRKPLFHMARLAGFEPTTPWFVAEPSERSTVKSTTWRCPHPASAASRGLGRTSYAKVTQFSGDRTFVDRVEYRRDRLASVGASTATSPLVCGTCGPQARDPCHRPAALTRPRATRGCDLRTVPLEGVVLLRGSDRMDGEGVESTPPDR